MLQRSLLHQCAAEYILYKLKLMGKIIEVHSAAEFSYFNLFIFLGGGICLHLNVVFLIN
ncbi:hypothetical protein CIPAW_04G172000 [Carya illinoinensis]|uniref:Uncharacterized protein n=1 Tax=Carya illinoinensis TaxID=32201 RepID=A0A8T1QXC4_CARIL|nr:hypothetical protein CIPAW_04G172000 [Carya illinoinensis]